MDPTLEHVVQINFDVNTEQLTAARRTTEDKIRGLQSSVTEIAKEGDRERGSNAKKAIDQQFKDFDDATKQRLVALQTSIQQERSVVSELNEFIKQNESSKTKASMYELGEARQKREEYQRSAEQSEKQLTQIIKEETEVRKRLRLEGKLPEDPKERYESKQDRIKELRTSSLMEDDDIRGAKRGTLGGQMFNEASKSVRSIGTGPEGAMASSLAGMGASITGVLMGMTNPITALVEVASGIKTIITNGYDIALKNSADQVKLIGGTAELTRMATSEWNTRKTDPNWTPGAGAEKVRKENIDAQSRVKTSHEFPLREDEQKDVASVFQIMTAKTPKMESGGGDAVLLAREMFMAARLLGQNATDIAKVTSDMARLSGNANAGGVAAALAKLEEIGRTATDTAAHEGTFDPQKLIGEALKLYEQMQPFGFSISEASESVFRWRTELDKGTVTIGQLMETAMGVRKQDVGVRAYEAETAVGVSAAEAKKGGFAELADILRPEKSAIGRGAIMGTLAGGANIETLRETLPGGKDMTTDQLKVLSIKLQEQTVALAAFVTNRDAGPIADGATTALGRRSALIETRQMVPTHLTGVEGYKGADAQNRAYTEASKPVAHEFEKLETNSRRLAEAYRSSANTVSEATSSWTKIYTDAMSRFATLVQTGGAMGAPASISLSGTVNVVGAEDKVNKALEDRIISEIKKLQPVGGLTDEVLKGSYKHLQDQEGSAHDKAMKGGAQ